jgi:hypothetical protein
VHYGGVKGGNTNGRCLAQAINYLEAYNVEIGLNWLWAKSLQFKRVHNNSLKPWLKRIEEEKKDFVFSNQENQVNPGSDNKELVTATVCVKW